MQAQKLSPIDELELISKAVLLSKHDDLMIVATNKTIFGATVDNLIIDCLDFDYFGTLELAVKIRTQYSSQNFPAFIVGMAINYRNLHMTDKKILINSENTQKLQSLICQSILNPMDIWIQFKIWQNIKHGSLYCAKNIKNRKRNMPRVLRFSWCQWIEQNLNDKMCSKYFKKAHIIDLINIVHCNPNNNKTILNISKIDPLYKSVKVKSIQTIESLLSQGKSPEEAYNILFPENKEATSNFSILYKMFSFGSDGQDKDENKFPHKQILKNIVNIGAKTNNDEFINKLMTILHATVENNKQQAFDYYFEMIKIKTCMKIPKNISNIIVLGLEQCMNKKANSVTKINQSALFLFDDSSTNKINIDNNILSTVFMNHAFNDARMGVFREKFIMYDMEKNNDCLGETRKIMESIRKDFKQINEQECEEMGGLNIFFEQAFNNVQAFNVNNIIIYSNILNDIIYANINKYRELINPKTNFYIIGKGSQLMCVKNYYRLSILSKWDPNVLEYINEMNKFWNTVDK
jgi:hypothetical protein